MLKQRKILKLKMLQLKLTTRNMSKSKLTRKNTSQNTIKLIIMSTRPSMARSIIMSRRLIMGRREAQKMPSPTNMRKRTTNKITRAKTHTTLNTNMKKTRKKSLQPLNELAQLD